MKGNNKQTNVIHLKPTPMILLRELELQHRKYNFEVKRMNWFSYGFFTGAVTSTVASCLVSYLFMK